MKAAEVRLLDADEARGALLANDLTDWLVEYGLAETNLEGLVDGFVVRLEEVGLSLQRMLLASDLLHPVMGAMGVRWERGQGVHQETYARDDSDKNEDWQRSPLYQLVEGEQRELRRRLERDYRRGEFSILDRFQAEGGTDYFALKADFGPNAHLGEVAGIVCSFLTDRPGGFTAMEVQLLRRLIRPLALAYKSINLLETARGLLTTYLGEDAARRVGAGVIERGRAEQRHAILWYSDLQGSTRIADTLPPGALLELLNDYADVLVSVIHAHGGQVLKFTGDGIFAMFDGQGDAAACARALDAAAAARREIDALNERRARDGKLVTGFYLSLHVGEVLFGNIGARDRLDFTLVGPAVNEAARIEAMGRSLDQWLIVSQAFAAAAGPARARLLSLGRYALRGVSRPAELFTLDPAG